MLASTMHRAVAERGGRLVFTVAACNVSFSLIADAGRRMTRAHICFPARQNCNSVDFEILHGWEGVWNCCREIVAWRRWRLPSADDDDDGGGDCDDDGGDDVADGIDLSDEGVPDASWTMAVTGYLRGAFLILSDSHDEQHVTVLLGQGR